MHVEVCLNQANLNSVVVDVVTGRYDAIAVVQGEALNEIGNLITAKVHPIGGISRIVTCLALKSS